MLAPARSVATVYMRKTRRILLGVALAVLVTPCVILGPYVLRVRHFRAHAAAGYHADFFLYVAPAAKGSVQAGGTATLLVQPNNSGTNSDDPGVHRRDAWWTGFGRHGIADELGVVLLVPAFVRPAGDWHIYTHALDRDALTTTRPDLARLDLQLLAMVDHARAVLAREGLPVDERFLIQGFSASGMFANRFTALHPTRIKAAAVGSPGGWPIAPLARFAGEVLPYPLGVADLESLNGSPFDSLAFNAVPQLFVMGSRDDNDSLDFRDGWEKEPAAIADRLFGTTPLARWKAAETLYRDAGTNARFVLVDGVGHDRKQLQRFSTGFFAGVLDR
jgi:pimeloyl-ACP methyl ester carboxylesterase